MASKAFQRCLVVSKLAQEALKLARAEKGLQFYVFENWAAPGHDSLVPEEMEQG